MSFGFRHLAPAVGAFMLRYPEVRVELTLTDRLVNLIEDNVDVAIRIGDLRDSSLIARKLARCRMLLCAAPSYLKRPDVPKHPRDLKDHSCLAYSYWLAGDEWRFKRKGEEVAVHAGDAPLRCNNGDAVAEAAAAPLIRQGRLVEILTAWRASEFGVYAVYPESQFVPAKSRAFMDHLAETYARLPWS
jgi:DNA-binding transcriptional LysR family regulator